MRQGAHLPRTFQFGRGISKVSPLHDRRCQLGKIVRGQFFHWRCVFCFPVLAHGTCNVRPGERVLHGEERGGLGFVTRPLTGVHPPTFGRPNDGGGGLHALEDETGKMETHVHPSVERGFHAPVPRHAVDVVGQLLELWVG